MATRKKAGVDKPVEKEEKSRTESREKSRTKNPAAVALGRLGGQAPRSGPRGFAAIPKARRKQLSMAGVKARKNLRRAS